MMAELVILAGSSLTLLSAVGMVRFREVFSRMHTLSKASTTGVLLILIGAAISLDHPNDVTSLLLAAALQIVTSPIGATMVSRATYLAEGITLRFDTVDEFAEVVRRRREQARYGSETSDDG